MVEGDPQEPPTLVEGVPGDLLEPLVLEGLVPREEGFLSSSSSSLDGSSPVDRLPPCSPVDMLPPCSPVDMLPKASRSV